MNRQNNRSEATTQREKGEEMLSPFSHIFVSLSISRYYIQVLKVEEWTWAACAELGNLSKDVGCGNDNVKKQKYDWLRKEKYSCCTNFRAFAILYKTTTWNLQILGVGDNTSIH